MIFFLSKLEAYGIKDSTYKFFPSYLNIHTQKCVVNGSISESKSIAFGISQGDNFRPASYLSCISGNNVDIIEQKLNHYLIIVSNWLVANKLTLTNPKQNLW